MDAPNATHAPNAATAPATPPPFLMLPQAQNVALRPPSLKHPSTQSYRRLRPAEN